MHSTERGLIFSLTSTVLQESVAVGHPELVGLVLRYRDQQQSKVQSQEIPVMLERLQSTPDYYIEMKWEVSSWGKWRGGRERERERERGRGRGRNGKRGRKGGRQTAR